MGDRYEVTFSFHCYRSELPPLTLVCFVAVRTRLKEMPELGISARGSYAIQEGSSISEVYHELAGTLKA
jgi:hypothetical protein